MEGHRNSRTQIEAECLIIPSGVGQGARQQHQIHFLERSEKALDLGATFKAAIIDNLEPARENPESLTIDGLHIFELF